VATHLPTVVDMAGIDDASIAAGTPVAGSDRAPPSSSSLLAAPRVCVCVLGGGSDDGMLRDGRQRNPTWEKTTVADGIVTCNNCSKVN
jgi:hypothetical protein